MKILNLYAGIGGNRKLWGDEREITAVEYKPEIAKVYQDLFPKDTVIIGDAHQYLVDHYSEFDFIWSSPPCPSHSKMRKGFSVANGAKPIYPDMKLYEEILFLQGFFKGKFCVENVIAWYEPLITPTEMGRHYYWTNFYISSRFDTGKSKINITGTMEKQSHNEQIEKLATELGFDLSKISFPDKRLVLRNCVEPEVGKYILDCSKDNPLL